jgi:nifR3 family TIM-barrel protein
MRLGPLDLPTDLLLAPMMDVTTPSFRAVLKSWGGIGLIVTPMVFVSQISCAPKTLTPHLELLEQQRPCSVQIVGSGRNEQHIKAAFDFLQSYKFDAIDINAGCPAPHTMHSGGGSAFLKAGEMPRLKNMIEYTLKYSDRPVSLKTRLGYEDPTQIMGIIEEIKGYDLAFLTLHGRTAKQKYSGEANYAQIQKVKEICPFPLVGNGNVVDFASYQKIKAETGCDAVMIGRAAMDNPWIFQQIAALQKDPTNPELLAQHRKSCSIGSLRQYLQEILNQIDQLSRFWNTPRFKLAEIRRLTIWAIKGIPGYKRVREGLSKINNFEHLWTFINSTEFEQKLDFNAAERIDQAESDNFETN